MLHTANYLLTLLAVFALTLVMTRALIPRLRALKMGQRILEIGPRWHKDKEGTPTMGGLSFLFAVLVVSALMYALYAPYTPTADLLPLALTLLYAFANSAVGIADDLTKVKKRQNEGLHAWQKILLQSVFAAAYLALLFLYDIISTELPLPFTNVVLDLGPFYFPFAFLLLIGTVNCANLTDGVDGLASSVAMVIGGFFSYVAFQSGHVALMVLGACMLASALAFLIYNYHPARIFMGDTGSLFLGALAVGCAFIIDSPLIIVLCGAVYFIEGLSVILQVLYFKLSGGRRLFLMAPIHHHLEKLGWHEEKVVSVLTMLSILLAVIAYFGLR
ncbi:MAG: phospho-N-acetylmuramoyl-pentapeptide-transferase [Eubacteriales bacterium]